MIVPYLLYFVKSAFFFSAVTNATMEELNNKEIYIYIFFYYFHYKVQTLLTIQRTASRQH